VRIGNAQGTHWLLARESILVLRGYRASIRAASFTYRAIVTQAIKMPRMQRPRLALYLSTPVAARAIGTLTIVNREIGLLAQYRVGDIRTTLVGL